MRYVDINVFGVFVSPLVPMLLFAWLVTVTLRKLANRIGLLGWFWHPALVVFAVYVIVLSSMVLIVGT